ncbi:MAG: pyridoxal phosphate-dependent decarboxylase family protein [Acidimicrobiales bacterium]
MTGEHESFLAYLPGPKGENSELLKVLFDRVLDDYFHWRRNYYPSDPAVTTSAERTLFREEHSDLEEKLFELLGRLRRSFPFYSPRYLAHQQGEVAIPALVGSLAGMLYNSNNVTSETGAVTVEYEIDACQRLLQMIGFEPPPDPPEIINETSLWRYRRRLESGFAWSHLTSGGTVANIEALWVARAVHYFPLSVRDVAQSRGLKVSVPYRGDLQDIVTLSYEQLLGLAPSATLELLTAYLGEIHRYQNARSSQSEIVAMAWNLLREESQYSVADGIARCMADFPPAIFVSGAAHYSISKALDLLGIGRSSLIHVDTDGRFRLDAQDLEAKVRDVAERGSMPMAVIGIVGTTEEGAVDPLEAISELRDRLADDGLGMWLHVDAAWGGYFRTLLLDSREDRLTALVERITELCGSGDAVAQHSSATDGAAGSRHRALDRFAELMSDEVFGEYLEGRDPVLRSHLISVGAISIDEAIVRCREVLQVLVPELDTERLEEDRAELFARVRSDVSDEFDLEMTYYDYEAQTEHVYRHHCSVSFDDETVFSALQAIDRADSVTVDPHKMGYVNYPCGAIAFRDDRVRTLVRQKAPYITGVSESRFLNLPPRHLVLAEGGGAKVGTVSTEAFAPYTLEGSRPSFPATALWLATELMPLDRVHHGALMTTSWSAARELYEWLVHLDDICDVVRPDRNFEVVVLSGDDSNASPPDTNIITFAVKAREDADLGRMNRVTREVYTSFAIQAELGQHEFSYSQPFFLSTTHLGAPAYSTASLRPLFKRSNLLDAEEIYEREGLVVLRSTVMNPYIVSLRRQRRQDVIREFIEELMVVADRVVERTQ